MAETKKKIHELTTDSTYDGDYFVAVDTADLVESKKMKLSVVVSAEATARANADTAIKAGAGLESDGTLEAIATSTYLRQADFEAASLTKTLKNAAILLDEALADVEDRVDGINSLTTETIVIEGTAPRRLYTEPVTIITCPEGYFINIVDCVGVLDYSGGALNCGTSDLIIRYADGTDIGTFSNTFLESEADALCKMTPEEHYALKVGENVIVYTTADDTGGASTSDLIFHVTYQIIEA